MNVPNNAPVSARRSISNAEPYGAAIRIVWDDGSMSDFDCLSLRDGCDCAACPHPQTLERTFNLLTVPEDISAQSVDVTPNGALQVAWAGDGHISEYDPAWFADREDLTAPAPRRETWDADYAPKVARFSYADVMGDDINLRAWLETIRDHGIALLEGAAGKPGEVDRIAARIAYPRHTNFGTTFDVVAMANPNSNAYTGMEIHGHTDLTFYKYAPGYFFLHCLAHDADGGESTFVDGFHVAQALKDDHPTAYEILTQVPFEFRFKDNDYDIRYREPLIGLDSAGQPRQVRFNISCMHSPVVTPQNMATAYRAYRRFAALIVDPRYRMRFKMAAGDIVGFDNSRVFHGRTAFDETGGRRHLQGIYVDQDEFLSRIRTIEPERHT